MGTFLCPECGKNFSVDADLYLHQVRAHDTNSYTCENCGETVIGKKTLDNHMRKHNTAVTRLKRSHNCEECPYETKDKANLSKHTKRVHSEKPKKIKKSRECGECGKTFQHKGHFDTHVKSHNGRQSEPLKTCEYCDYKCCRNDDLEKHVKGAHESVQRVTTNAGFASFVRSEKVKMQQEYLCHECSKTFNSKSNLKRRILTGQHATAKKKKPRHRTTVMRKVKKFLAKAENLEEIFC